MDDITLITIDANTIYNTIITSLETSVSEPLYPGDERRMFGEAIVAVFVALYNNMNDVAKQTMLRYARGEVLDALGGRTDTQRLPGDYATTTMRFSLTTPRSENIIIPQWTKVTPDSVLYFATDSTAVLQAGTYSVDIPTSAVGIGVKYNGYLPGTITTLVDLIPYIESVTNLTETAGGDDGEPYTTEGDDRYRERIRIAPSKQSTAGPEEAYKYWTMTADASIVDATVISELPGQVKIIPLLEGGQIPSQELMQKILNTLNAETIRPLTDYVSVTVPEQVEYGISLKYYTAKEDEAEVIQNVEGEGGAIDRYNLWQTNALGRDINPDQLRKLILCPDWSENPVGADRVEIFEPAYRSLVEMQVAKWNGQLNVTHEVTAGVV